jgi:DNA-binding helix-hairpin-helix protein with protein kinase domain
MIVLLTRHSNNQPVSLTKQIANSGEGQVWETNLSGYLAKIYHDPTPARIAKLKVMLANPPADPMLSHNHVSIAWVSDLLKDSNDKYLGFLMPAIADSKQLSSVYNPRLRKKVAPGFNWYYLHVTVLNTAWIIQSIHAKGYVLGDIKLENILVNNRAMTAVIDTDSFQVRDPQSNQVYPCTVGSEGFTPPELLGKDFDTTNQTEIHDRFRLGVLIHYLLFGYHPFSGNWTGVGESPEQTELIKQGYWYGGHNSPIRATKTTIPLYVVHPELEQLFLKCFNEGHIKPHLRPTALDWHNALEVAVNQLTSCNQVDSHHYSKTYGECYWCERAADLGVDIFPGGIGKAKIPFKKSETIKYQKDDRALGDITQKYFPKKEPSSSSQTTHQNHQSKSQVFKQNSTQLSQVAQTAPSIIVKHKNKLLIASAAILVAFSGIAIYGLTTSYLQTKAEEKQAEIERQQLQQKQDLAESEIEGYIVGAGISLKKDENKFPIVVKVFEDSSAYERGIKVDDRILKINGKSTANKDLAYVTSLIRGEVNTQVTLKIARLGQKNQNFNLTRSRFRNDNIAESYFNRGNARFDLKDYRAAIEDYTQAIRLNPGDSSGVYDNRGNAYFNLKDYRAAIEDYTQTIRLNPDDADTYFNRGNAYSNLEEYQRAIEDYTQAIRLNPDDANAYNNRGNTYSNLEEYQKAIEDYTQAIRLNPDYADAYNNRGAILYNHLGDRQGATEDFEKAASLGDETARKNLKIIQGE